MQLCQVNRYLAYLSICAVTTLLCACDASRKWTEDVQLQDGRIVSIQRTSTASRFGEIGQKTGATKYWSIKLDGRTPLFWEGDIPPVIFAIDTEHAYVVTQIHLTWRDCGKYGYPDPPFVYFRSRQSSAKWERISSDELPNDLRVNLLQGIWTDSDATAKKVFHVHDRLKIDFYSPLVKSGFDKSKPYAETKGCGEVKSHDQATTSK